MPLVENRSRDKTVLLPGGPGHVEAVSGSRVLISSFSFDGRLPPGVGQGPDLRAQRRASAKAPRRRAASATSSSDPFTVPGHVDPVRLRVRGPQILVQVQQILHLEHAEEAARHPPQCAMIFSSRGSVMRGGQAPFSPSERKNSSRSAGSSSHHPRTVEVSWTDGVQTESSG